jgi:hypothetical protein
MFISIGLIGCQQSVKDEASPPGTPDTTREQAERIAETVHNLDDAITNITVEDLSGPKTIEFTNEEDVNSVIELLKLDEWVKLKDWNIKLSPNLYVVINKDIVIGLFKGDSFAKIEGSNDGYYEIPKDVNIELSRFLESFD